MVAGLVTNESIVVPDKMLKGMGVTVVRDEVTRIDKQGKILGGKLISDLTTFTSACNPDISSEPGAEPSTIAAEQALQKRTAE